MTHLMSSPGNLFLGKGFERGNKVIIRQHIKRKTYMKSLKMTEELAVHESTKQP